MLKNIEENNLKINSNPVLRWILIISGFVLTGIGIAGMFLPLLPTTIFLLLAAWCFARSSEKFYKWLHNNRLFGKYLSDYSSGKGMTLRSKVFSISFLWLGLILSGIFATEVLFVRILLLFIGIGVTWHLLAIKTADHK
ncbi:MAG: YbaN family protein [Ignavibacteria bacterium]|jgi:uncharacterized membrane protein YbaN (DUF454 family)|nr:YbaN family protein [Ignavibacteria bacterium]